MMGVDGCGWVGTSLDLGIWLRVLAAVHDVRGGACLLFVIGRGELYLPRVLYDGP